MGGKSGKVAANREYKDTVFTRLFRDRAKLAELYNAIAGTSYTADDVTIVTLDNVIFVGRENDIANAKCGMRNAELWLDAAEQDTGRVRGIRGVCA